MPESPSQVAEKRTYLVILPWAHVLRPGETIRYRISACDAKGVNVETRIVWEATGGTMAPDGTYTAGHTLGRFEVRARDALSGECARATLEIQDHGQEENLLSKPPYRPSSSPGRKPTADGPPSLPPTSPEDADPGSRSGAPGSEEEARPRLAGPARAVAEALQSGAGGAWAPVLDPSRSFDAILGHSDERFRYRFYLKVLPEASIAELTGVLAYAEAAVESVGPDELPERHCYLLLGPGLATDRRVEGVARAFNERMWKDRDAGQSRAYVAYSELEAWAPNHPGIEDPQPDLRSLIGPRPRPIPPQGGPGTRANVLVVDDSPLVLDMMKDLLRPSGFVVFHAHDWATFKAALEAARFAALVLDVCMPGLTGDKLALFVKQFVPPPTPRILLYSATPEPELRRLARRVGADGYLCKGAEPATIVRSVAAAVRAFEDEAGR